MDDYRGDDGEMDGDLPAVRQAATRGENVATRLVVPGSCSLSY